MPTPTTNRPRLNWSNDAVSRANFAGASTRQRRDQRAGLDACRRQCDRGQTYGRSEYRYATMGTVEMIPYEEPVETRCLGLLGETGNDPGIGELAERRQIQPETRLATTNPTAADETTYDAARRSTW